MLPLWTFRIATAESKFKSVEITARRLSVASRIIEIQHQTVGTFYLSFSEDTLNAAPFPGWPAIASPAINGGASMDMQECKTLSQDQGMTTTDCSGNSYDIVVCD